MGSCLLLVDVLGGGGGVGVGMEEDDEGCKDGVNKGEFGACWEDEDGVCVIGDECIGVGSVTLGTLGSAELSVYGLVEFDGAWWAVDGLFGLGELVVVCGCWRGVGMVWFG